MVFYHLDKNIIKLGGVCIINYDLLDLDTNQYTINTVSCIEYDISGI